MENSDKDLINLSREEAERILNEEGTKFRYDFIEGDMQKRDITYDVDRINLSVQDGKIIATSRG